VEDDIGAIAGGIGSGITGRFRRYRSKERLREFGGKV
jgi:hypothetical protein